MNNKLAIIDLGTNTFHLLIGERKGSRFIPIHQERIAAKLGVGGINNNLITEAAILRALDALEQFKTKLDSFQIQNIFCFGTSAIRNASNQSQLILRIKSKTGLDVKVISGDEEAQLIYKGVASAIAMGNDAALIVDIGGGSVEFIIANNTEVFWKQSFEIGGQRLIERFQLHDPILPHEINQINAYFFDQLKPLLEQLQTYNPTSLLGSSGSFDTLSEIYCYQNRIIYNGNDPETPLTLTAFSSIHQQLIGKNRSERLQIPGMIELRVDMIVVGSCLIKFLLDSHCFENIRVSTYSLKEGVLTTLS